VVVATTTLAADDAVAELARRTGARVVRGPVEDVLGRYVLAAASWPGRFVIRATADNPLVDVEACGRVLECLEAGADYVGESGLPVGAAVEGMTTVALRLAGREAEDAYDREHVTPWLRRGEGHLTIGNAVTPAGLARADLSFTIDTPSDLAFVRALVGVVGPDPLVALADAIRAADRLTGRGEGA
jgi:spore coat polysaccharide biosynthesis protein SpsF